MKTCIFGQAEVKVKAVLHKAGLSGLQSGPVRCPGASLAHRRRSSVWVLSGTLLRSDLLPPTAVSSATSAGLLETVQKGKSQPGN